MENDKKAYIPVNNDLAGLSIAGYRQKEGSILILDSGTYLEDWPKEVYLLKVTYTLEDIIKGVKGYECAEYV